MIENELEAHGIPWDNCLALGSDNANVMVGADKGVYGCMLRRHPNMYLSGCVCHLIHIAFVSLEFFLNRFQTLLPIGATASDVEKEFALYQITDIQGCMKDTTRVDEVWGRIAQFKEDGEPCF